jgi:predicted metalloprotease
VSYGYGNWPPPPAYTRRRRGGGFKRLLWGLVLLAGVGISASVVFNSIGGILSTLARDIPIPGVSSSPPSEPGPALPANVAGVLQDNRLYDAGSPGSVDCPAPRLTSSSAQAQEDYDKRIFDCLNRGWQGVLATSGFSTSDPDLFVFNQSGSSPCGTFEPATGQILAFYCPVNQTMYADAEQMAKAFPARDHVVYALVLAHEYGHHLQNVAGILDAEQGLAYRQPSQANELSRRTEVQASCLAGVFIRAIEDSYPVSGNQRSAFEFYAFRAFGDSDGASDDERTHGTSRSQGEWIARGFNDGETGDCNSYSASASTVE